MKMDTNTLKRNLKTVKELILDEQKIVTYISISKELCIHVNDAKSILSNVVEDIRKSQPETDICVSYMISGLLSDCSACTTVCSETDVESLRSNLKTLFYKHVYCVGPGDQTVNNAALTAINKLEDFPLCTGLIKSNSCIKRTDDEIENLITARNHNVSIEANQKTVIKKSTSEKQKEVAKPEVDVKRVVSVKSEPVLRSKTPSPKKNVLTGNTKKNTSAKPPTKGIAGFFSKANGDANKIKNNKVKEEKIDVVEKIKLEKEIRQAVEPDIYVTDAKTEANNKSAKKTNSSLKPTKKVAKVDKKRKRVLHVSDSESDTETNDPFAEDENKMPVDPESEDEIPPTPTANTVKITSGIVNPKKRRKIVDKTYTDEDGYILTKKEEVYESCSDNEEDVKKNIEDMKQVTHVKTEKPVRENSKSKKKVSPPQKGKQQMLTNFFKKV